MGNADAEQPEVEVGYATAIVEVAEDGQRHPDQQGGISSQGKTPDAVIHRGGSWAARVLRRPPRIVEGEDRSDEMGSADGGEGEQKSPDRHPRRDLNDSRIAAPAIVHVQIQRPGGRQGGRGVDDDRQVTRVLPGEYEVQPVVAAVLAIDADLGEVVARADPG